MKAEKLEKIIEYSKTNPIKDKKYRDKSKRRMVESYRRLETIDLLLLSRLQPIDLLRELSTTKYKGHQELNKIALYEENHDPYLKIENPNQEQKNIKQLIINRSLPLNIYVFNDIQKVSRNSSAKNYEKYLDEYLTNFSLEDNHDLLYNGLITGIQKEDGTYRELDAIDMILATGADGKSILNYFKQVLCQNPEDKQMLPKLIETLICFNTPYTPQPVTHEDFINQDIKFSDKKITKQELEDVANFFAENEIPMLPTLLHEGLKLNLYDELKPKVLQLKHSSQKTR